MRFSKKFFAGALLLISILIFGGAVRLSSSSNNQVPPGVQKVTGVSAPGVMESTYGPQPPDPAGFTEEKEAAENLYEFDEATMEALKNRQLPVGAGGATKVLQAPREAGGGGGPQMAPSLGTNFTGIDQSGGGGFFPADPNGTAGPNHVIVAVNLRWNIYTKTGTQTFTSSFGSWFSSVNPSGLNLSDPRVTYDQYAGRWIVMCIGYGNVGNPVGAYFVSVSDDSDPNGTWFKWNTPGHIDNSTVTTNFPDYPSIGFDSTGAVYFTSNQFPVAGGGFQYTKMRILKKSELYANNPTPPPLTYTDFIGVGSFTLRIAHTFGSVNGDFAVNSSSGGGSVISLWRINNPITSPTVTLKANVNIGAYTPPPNATQPGGATPINTLDARISGDVYYRNGHIFLALCEGHNFGGGTVAAIRYVEMDTSGTVVYQNITHGADLENFFFPAPIPVCSGNAAIGYSHSSPASFVSARYAGNFPADLTQGVLKAGVATHVEIDGAGRNRWGDYSATAVDPVFPRRVWIFNMYCHAMNSWNTWAGFITLQNNKPNIVNPGPIVINEGDTRVDTIPVTEPDCESIASFLALAKPGYATFANLGGGKGVLTLSPGCTDAGVDTVKLRAADNGVPFAADTELIEITVVDKNAPPAIVISPPDTVKLYACCSTCVSITATDCDNGPSPLVIFADSLPSCVTLTDSGGGKASLCCNDIVGLNGAFLISVKATDGQDTTTVTVTIQVLPKGDLNGDGIYTAADVVAELNCVFLGIQPPVPSACDACDLDGGGPTASDVVKLLNTTFLGDPLPPC